MSQEAKFDALMEMEVAGFKMDAVLLSVYIQDMPEVWRKIDDVGISRGIWTGERLDTLRKAQEILHSLGRCSECGKPTKFQPGFWTCTRPGDCFGRSLRRGVLSRLFAKR